VRTGRYDLGTVIGRGWLLGPFSHGRTQNLLTSEDTS